MYDFIDQRVSTLDRSGQFLIWAMRSWVLANQSRRCPPNAIGPSFAKWGMTGALPHFHAAMMILCKEGIHKLYFAPISDSQISDDEAMMLSLFRSLRNDLPDRARGTTELLVTEGFVAPLFAALMAVSMRMADSRLNPKPSKPSRSSTRAAGK